MKKTTILAMLILALGFVSCNNKTKKSNETKEVKETKKVNKISDKQALEKWIKNYIKENGDEESKTTYTFSKVALTKNTTTYFVNLEGEIWCGTGGCPTLLVSKNDETFKLMNDFSPIQELKIGEKEVNSWKELHIVIGDGGSSENQKYQYKTTSKKYELVE